MDVSKEFMFAFSGLRSPVERFLGPRRQKDWDSYVRDLNSCDSGGY